MTTTIQIEEDTLKELRKLKGLFDVETYNEVVQRLLMTNRKRTMPVRGVTPYLGPFERDHNDRD